MYSAKALVQLLCERFHDPENGHIFIPGVSILSRRKFCVQEVLMHMCLLSFHRNALFGLILSVSSIDRFSILQDTISRLKPAAAAL
jgi:hypothetical protein